MNTNDFPDTDKRCYIKDIKLNEPNPYIIYGLMIKIGSRYRVGGPDSIYITDFSSNTNVGNPVKPKPFLSQLVNLHDEQVLAVDTLRNRLLAIEYLYKERYDHEIGIMDFLNSGERFLMVAHKLVLLKLRLKPKVYRGTIEPQVILFQIVNEVTEDAIGKQFIRELYRNIAMLLPQFFDPLLREKILPATYFRDANGDVASSQDVSSSQPFQSAQTHRRRPSFSDPDSDSDESLYESQVRSQLSQLQSQSNFQSLNNNSNSTSSSNKIYATQAAQIVKEEVDLDDSLVPDTEFQNDYVSSPSGIDGETLFQVPNTVRETHYLISQLNDIHSALDNKIYKTNAYIIGTNPADWSHVCAKSYEFDSVSNKYELTDPALRGLELIITDVAPSGAKYLSPNDFLTITLSDSSLRAFFGDLGVEEIYTSIGKLNARLHESKSHTKLHQLELYKAEIEINPKTHDKIAIWNIHNFTINDIDRA